MKTFLKRKQLMLVALVAALGLAVYLNVYLVDSPALTAGTETEEQDDAPDLGEATFVGTGVSDPEEQPSYFDEARQKRTAAREEALSIIQEVLDSAQASAEDKAQATQRATAIAENVLQESNIENLILAKGYPDSVVYIDGERCSVVVQAESLQQQDSLLILQIVVSQSAVPADGVQIVAAQTETDA